MKEHLDEKAMKRYTEMLIDQLNQMKESNWVKPWFSSNNFVSPRNINGRLYSGSNFLMLMFNQQEHNYELPVYMTWAQATAKGIAVNKGEKSFPINFWNRSIRDENGKKLTEAEYNELSDDAKEKCKIRPYQQWFNVFNADQTNIRTAQPDLWDALVKKLQPAVREMDESDMLKCAVLDKMLEDKSWLCPIYQEPDSSNAYFHKGNDEIVVPEKKQFIDGESFYGTLLHEMVHSTGIESRLNRDMSGGFGSENYSREELVAELGSAMAAINFGINKEIKDESKEYIKSWLDNMEKDPKFLMDIISDVAKAVDMVHKNVPEIAVTAEEHLSEENAYTTEESKEVQPSLEQPEAQEKTDEELDNEAYERESEAIDSGHKAHFIAAWKEGEPNNGTFYEVWLKDEDIQNEDGISKYRELPLWNIESMKSAFNIADTFYNREEIDAAWDEKFAGLAKDFSGLTKPVKAVEQELLEKLSSGEMLLSDAGIELEKNGLTDGRPSLMETYNFLKSYANGNSSVETIRVNEFELFPTLRNGVDVSLRDFAVDMPMTKHRVAMELAALVLATDDETQLLSTAINDELYLNPGKLEDVKLIKEAYADNDMDINEVIHALEEDIDNFLANNEVEQQAEVKPETEAGRQETMYYTSVAYLQNPDDTFLFDKLKEEEDYSQMLTEAAEFDYSHENGIDLAYTHLSAKQNTGDDILDENETYAIVYNNSVGGTYNILRKTPESEIWQMIQSDFLPKNASKDVRQLAERKTLDEFDRHPDVSHTLEMPNGRKLEWEFDRKDFVFRIGEKENGEFNKVERTIPYDFGLPLDEMLKDVHATMASELRNQISTASGEELQVKTLEESLRDKLYKGEMTLHDAGTALNKAGKVNYIPDAKETIEILNKHLESVTESSLLSEDGPFKVDEEALMSAINVGIDVSLRDFAIGQPPTDRRTAIGLTVLVLDSKNKTQLAEGLRLNNYAHSSEHVAALWSARQAFNEKTIELNKMVDIIQDSLETGRKENIEEKTEVKETEQASGEEKEESKLDLFQKIVDATLQGKHVNMPYEVYELLESMTDSELQQAKAIAEKRKGRSNMVKANMGDIRLKVEQQMMTRADDRNPEQAEKRGYEKTMKSMRESGTLFMARFDFESYIRHQKMNEEKMLQKNHPGLAAAQRGIIRAAQEYEKMLDREIEMLNKVSLQYDKLKEKQPDAILFFRTGDSYMIMRENAQAASQATDLQPKPYPLTKGEQPKEVLAIEFPASELDTYLPQMIRAGLRVAIHDGVEAPKLSKTEQHTEQTVESAENRQQQGYKDTLEVFKGYTTEYLKDFDFDVYISDHKEAVEFYEQHGKPLEAAYERGSVQAAEEMRVKYGQSTGKKEAPGLKYFYSGNGLSVSEEGDKDYTAFIAQNREVKLYKEFHPDNLGKIRQMAETGNMVYVNGISSTDKGYLIFDPVNKPSKIYENPMTMERYFLSVENINGKEVGTVGRTIMFDEKDKIDKLMDYTPENMTILEKKADDLLETKTQELRNAFRSGDPVTIQSASYSYMWASKYKLQQKYSPGKCNEEIKKIQESIIPQKNKNMEQAEKKEMKDGVSVFKMQNGQYGINETKDGVRSPTRRLHEEDVKAYFEGLKGQPKEEVNRRREILADKYLRGNAQTQAVSQTPKKELPPLSPENRQRLANTSVFKMQDGANYGVRTQIDGEQYSAKRVRREDIAAFFEGYKGLPKEEQEERKAQLAAMYFKEELEAPKQDLSYGMRR